MTNSPYLQFKLDNGIKIVAERIDTVKSVSIGMFVRSGVLYEEENLQGVSHLIEHMMFKGTINRTARQIASEFDRIGGFLNAYTSKDYCCYYARVVMDKLEIAVDILSDMIKNSQFDELELERERKVILEEIKMYEDTPDELIHELLAQNIWKKSKLGNPILGTVETVGKMKRSDILDYFHSQYVTNNLLVCVAGNFEPDELKRIVIEKLSGMRDSCFKACDDYHETLSHSSIYIKNIEQAHLIMGCEGLAYADKRKYALGILNAAFGGGMSSRLFQEIREKRGMAYTVYSYHTSFKNTGLFGIYAGTSMQHLPEVLRLFHEEIEKVAQSGLSESEIENTKEQLKGSTMLSLESTTNRMNRLTTDFLYDYKLTTPEESFAPYLEVTQEDIKQVAKDLLDEKKMAITMIVPSGEAVDILENSPFSKRELTICNLGRKN